MMLIKPNTNKFHFDNIFNDKPLVTNNFSIFQIGDLLCETDTVVEEHVQLYDLELSFITQGTGGFYTNNIKTIVEKGDVYLSFKDDIHRICSDNIEPMRYYYFAIDFNLDSPYYIVLKYLLNNYLSPDKRVIKLQHIFPLMTNILNEIANIKPFSIQLIESSLIQILVSLYRSQDSNNDIYKADLQKGLVYNIVSYIDNNFITIKDLKTISNIFRYDYSYLTKIFKIVMDKTIHRYLQEKKLNYAIQLLNDNYTVTEISELLGYSSVHNFSRAFKNEFNNSPQKFIK